MAASLSENKHSYKSKNRSRGKDSKRGWRGDQQNTNQISAECSEEDENNPILKAFRGFREELDCRNDRHERIVKLSRDITIESKRVIFLLQRVIGSEDSQKLLSEAGEKIQELNSTKFLEIAKELDGQESYQYLRAYTAGLQEYIEAVTFYYYLLDQQLVNWDKIQCDLKYPFIENKDSLPESEVVTKEEAVLPELDSDTSVTGTSVKGETLSTDQADSTQGSERSQLPTNPDKQISVHIPPSEYMLGVADFTGELMRMAINSVGAGDMDTPKVVANMMRVIFNAFSVFDNTSRELRRKGTVLRQSLQKVENACYTLTVRGSEIPKHMLADVFKSTDNYHMDEDEDNFD